MEEAAATALKFRIEEPYLGGVSLTGEKGSPVYSEEIGYVQHINMIALQAFAEAQNIRFVINAITGTFATSNIPLLYILADEKQSKNYITPASL